MFVFCTLHLFRTCQLINIIFTFEQNGPNTFGMASQVQLDTAPPPSNHDVRGPPNVQVPPNSMASKAHVEPPRGPTPLDQPPNVQVPHRNYENHDGPMNFNEQNARSSPRFQDSASTDVSANKPTTSGKFHPEERSSGTSIATERLCFIEFKYLLVVF